MNLAIMGAIEQGLLFGILALGVYLTFRILNVPDLTVDGSFALGGAIAAKFIIDGTNPYLATLLAFIVGGLAGAFTGVLHTKGKVNALLAGILTMIALYSINLRIMGKANLPLLREDTLFTYVKDLSIPDLTVGGVTLLTGVSIVFFVGVLVLKLVIDWFLHTDLGLDLRATGDNPKMIRSFGVNTDTTTIIGLALSNGLVAVSGAWVAQFQGFADVGMGIGMIVIGLASVIVGEVLFGSSSIFRVTLAVILGSIVYRLVIALALQAGLNPSDMKLITALIVIVALTVPTVAKGIWKKQAVRSVRGGNSNA
ncbi:MULTISPECIES: ABC transporter permease [Brevibacillus]|jgi:putative ABC transport system permease protein|uniref:ABC transporter permease n=1 Tax=Brevibacillus parabrevis TaxID=54914 RepID=A0A4Y3PNG6_BREPA|nr:MULTISPECIES: ABC transporter permease [Brevibacillus]MBU8715566.1 ABC transporter permease [Brevibacillus parabrevis]MDH6352199.1 putative ABC transport system permease protein [Brevibacillus sp. 1238]MDR4998933.1 ABC transporter permease [Brevibacillus parabrevis]MED1722310.1 ABC transporter permease [Brevibacillus parabrevis]MED2254502.1 ABC transporter permease [Brevibacillus parabrevis]